MRKSLFVCTNDILDVFYYTLAGQLVTLKHLYWVLVLNTRDRHENFRVSTSFVQYKFRSGSIVTWLTDGQRGLRRSVSAVEINRSVQYPPSCLGPVEERYRKLTPEVYTLQLPLLLFSNIAIQRQSRGTARPCNNTVPLLNTVNSRQQCIQFKSSLTVIQSHHYIQSFSVKPN